MSNSQRIVIVMGVLALFLSRAALLSHAEDIQKKQERINVRLVWKSVHADRLIPDGKTFPPTEIQAEIESESTSEVGKRFLINTLREQVARHDRLVFFEGGKVLDLKREGYHFVCFSPNGQIVGFGKGGDRWSVGQFVLMTNEGRLLWRKTSLHKLIRILDGGEVVVGFVPLEEGFMPSTLYGQKGEVLIDFEKLDPTLQADPSHRPILVHFSRLKWPQTLWLFASEGKALLKKEIQDFVVWSAVLSDDGRYILLNGVDKIYADHPVAPMMMKRRLLDRSGNLIREYLFWDTIVDFSPDGGYLAIITNGKSLDFIESSTGKILWQNPKKSEENRLWSVAVSENGEFVLLSGRLSAEKKSSGFLLSKKGEIIWRESLGLADVFIARDGSFFFIAAGDSLYCYAIDH